MKKEKTAWLKERQTYLVRAKNHQTQKKKDTSIGVKYAHQEKMAELALEAQKLGLEQNRQRHEQREIINNGVLEGKKSLVEFNFERREFHKEKEAQRKEEIKTTKLKNANDRFQTISLGMNQTNQLNGGCFPSIDVSVQQVSSHKRVVARLTI